MHRYLPLFLCVVSVQCAAQPTITAGQASPVIGETYLYRSGAYMSPGFGWSGGDMDLSSFTPTGTNNRVFVDPASTTYASYFPTATVAEVSGPGAWGYYRSSANGFEQTGVRSASSSLICAGGINVVPYPINYNDIVYDDYTCSGLSLGESFTRTGSSTVQADGYGNLITPYGTFNNVLRIAIYNNYNDLGTNIDDYGIVSSYLWYKPGIKMPLVGIYDLTGSFGIVQYTWMLDGSSIGIDEALQQEIGLEIHADPASTLAYAVFSASGQVAMQVIDNGGRSVRAYDLGRLAPGIHRQELDLSGLAPGLYTVLATDDHGGRGRGRLLVNAHR